MKIKKSNVAVKRGIKISVLAAFYLYVICFVSIGSSSESLVGGSDEDLLHTSQTLQTDGEGIADLWAEKINEENSSGETEDTEGTETEPLEDMAGQEQEPETTTEVKPPNQTALEETVPQEPEKDKVQPENVQAMAQEIKDDQALNKYVLEIIKTYPIGSGNYPYLLNNDYANYNGVTTTLTYQGKTLLKAHPSGNRASHCVGITFEVLFRAMQERNRQLGIPVEDFNGMNWDNLHDFVLNWYAASGSKKTNNIVLAVEKYGIGKRINRLEDVQAGDFIDFDRENGGGHAVVFINWIREADGRIIGFKYWSSQGSTGGINYNEEYFNIFGKNGAKYGSVIKDEMFMVRILPVSQYK